MYRRMMREILYLFSAVCLLLSVFAVMRISLLDYPAAVPAEGTDAGTDARAPSSSGSELLLRAVSEEYPTAFGVYDLLYAAPVRYPDETEEVQPPKPPPENSIPIVPRDLSRNQLPELLYLSNETDYTPDPSALIRAACRIDTGTSASVRSEPTEHPLVLILHTHGTESYLEEGASYAEADDGFHSKDPEKTVVEAGRILADTLNREGIPTLHCTVMHDLESYSGAYPAAKQTILSYLEKYPSIQYVLDVHRDALMTEAGEYIKPLVYDDASPVAQIMFVIGTNQNGANHPNWLTNLTVASKLQSRMIARLPGVMRPINLRKSSFNEQYTPGSMLIELGSNANTLDEAKRAAVLLGEELAALIDTLAE